MSKLTQTITFLATFNSWRRGNDNIEMQNPTEIGNTIDDAISLLREYDEMKQHNNALLVQVEYLRAKIVLLEKLLDNR
jgi:hypothetical protein